MTLLTLTRAEAAGTAAPRPIRARLPWAAAAAGVICLLQAGLALRPGLNPTPFSDEGLYVYIGHRMIAHLLHGVVVTEYPGGFLSGAPGFYPVLAALADDVDGLAGARDVSLVFALGATLSVNGLGRQLYGRLAGLLGALAFVLCGSVIYQSHFATYDSTMMFFVASAATLTVYSVRRDQFLLAPLVAVLLVTAFFAKYTGLVYIPVVAALAVAVAPVGTRLVVARRAGTMMLTAAALGYFLYALWGQSLRQGMVSTTLSRTVLGSTPRSTLLQLVAEWVGPWLALAVVGALVQRATWPVSLVLLAGSVLVPLSQIRIGEQTSLSKHVAFGMVFACPLIGALLSRLLRRPERRPMTIPLVTAAVVVLAGLGLHWSGEFMNAWADDAPLVPVLSRIVDQRPGELILGETPPPEHYYLRDTTSPQQWRDTWDFLYDHRSGQAAYAEAIDNSAFGVIYLARNVDSSGELFDATVNGAFIYRYLTTQPTAYILAATVLMTRHGGYAGRWYIYVRRAAPAAVQPQLNPPHGPNPVIGGATRIGTRRRPKTGAAAGTHPAPYQRSSPAAPLVAGHSRVTAPAAGHPAYGFDR